MLRSSPKGNQDGPILLIHNVYYIKPMPPREKGPWPRVTALAWGHAPWGQNRTAVRPHLIPHTYCVSIPPPKSEPTLHRPLTLAGYSPGHI